MSDIDYDACSSDNLTSKLAYTTSRIALLKTVTISRLELCVTIGAILS